MTVVVLDLFHTLVDPEDHRPADFRRAVEVACILGLPPDPFVADWDRQEPDRTRGTLPINPWMFADAARRNGIVPDAVRIERADTIYGRYQDQALMQPRPEVLDTLRQLRGSGHRLGLLSNAEARDVRTWPISPFAELFEVAVFSCDVQVCKPEAAAYRVVLDRLGVDAVGAVYVGDGGSDELRGARDTGFGQVIAARQFVPANGLRSEDEQRVYEVDAHAVIGPLAELAALL